MRTLILSLVFALIILVAGCGGNSAEPQARRSPDGTAAPYPDVQGDTGDGGTSSGNKNFATLMRRHSSAVINPAPWAGYWFPYSTNGVASAASKYDQATGQGAASWERGNHGLGLGEVADWWGHCNGWAAAATLVPEPREPRTIEGIVFDVADRKALLTEMFMEVTGDFLGSRVNNPGDFGSSDFEDVHPAQFFLVVTSIMGSQGRSVIVDRYTGHEVWNHPLVAYSTQPVTPADYLGPDPRFPNVHRVNVTTTMYWVEDNVEPDTLTPAFDPANPAPVFQSRELRYELWLDAPPVFDASGQIQSSGDVILTTQGNVTAGGEWKNSSLASVNSHPDYIWIPTAAAASSGYKNPRLDDGWVSSNMR